LKQNKIEKINKTKAKDNGRKIFQHNLIN